MRPSLRFGIATLILFACVALPLLVLSTNPTTPPGKVDFPVKAQKYFYTPHRIIINQGDSLHLRLSSIDAVHGFYFEGHDFEAMVFPGKPGFYTRRPSEDGEFQQVEEAVIKTDRSGKYHYRCSVTCGTFHPFMLGEVIIRPNTPYFGSLGAAIGIFLSGLFLIFTGNPSSRKRRTDRSVDLLKRLRILDRFVRKRWFQFSMTFPMLVFFTFLIIAGFFGSPIGNRNIIIVVVWIVWWFLLITLMVPLGGRFWCMVCPFPFFGEWLQRRKLIGGPDVPSTPSDPHPGGLKLKWPKALSNIWLQNIIFLIMCTFSGVLLTRPQVTAAVMGLIILAATLVHFLFPARTFCMYLCPLGGWMSVYSMAGSLAVRSRNPGDCTQCRTSACHKKSDDAWICPWFQEPDLLSRNNFCGLCMECVKTCEKGNLTVIARPFFSDTMIQSLGEAWASFIMITLVAVYSAIFLGPWPTVKNWANFTETGQWGGFILFSAFIWALCLLIVPAVWWCGAWLSRNLSGSRVKVRTIFKRYSYMLVPLGLMAWVAFAVPLVLLDMTYITSSISDPFGWGWDLFGTAQIEWRPFHPEYIVPVQIVLMLAGLALALQKGYSVARDISPHRTNLRLTIGLAPHSALCTAITVVMLRLIAG